MYATGLEYDPSFTINISNIELYSGLKLQSLSLDPAEGGMSRSPDSPATLTSLMAKLTRQPGQ